MTDSEFCAMFGEWVKRLGLSHWRINLNLSVPAAEMETDSSIATVTTHGAYDEADIGFIEGWSAWDDDKIERTMVHELVHLHLRDLDNMLDVASETMRPSGRKMFDALSHAAMENLVERMTNVLVDLRQCGTI